MSDNEKPDEPLLEAEQQMRRALGIGTEGPPKTDSPNGHTLSIGTFRQQPQPRRYVRDGDVPVTQLRREPRHQNDPSNHAARDAIRAQAAARENAERQLSELQARLQSVQTRLGHETIAKNEALDRAMRAEQALAEATETLKAVRTELVEERVGRQKAETRLKEALEARTRRPVRIYVPDTPTGLRAVQQAESKPPSGQGHDPARTTQGDSDQNLVEIQARRRPRIMVPDTPVDREPGPTTAPIDRRGRQATPVRTPDGTFASAALAAEHYGISRQTIFYRLKHVPGWAFVDDENALVGPAPKKRDLRQAAAPEVDETSDFVEWWKPGWRKKFGHR